MLRTTRRYQRNGRWLIALLVAVGLLLPNTSRGEVLTVGGTGAALGTMKVLLEAFQEKYPEVNNVVVPGLGDAGGIKAVLDGAIDLAVSARQAKVQERRAGALTIAYGKTAVVFAVPLGNPQTELTLSELIDIYTGKRTVWLDGSRVRVVLRLESESDTRFLKKHFPGMADAMDIARSRKGLPIAYTDQETAELMELIPGGIGATTLSLMMSERRRLKALSFDGVMPSVKSIADESYPYTRTLYFITGPRPNKLVPLFIDFVHSKEGRTLLMKTGHQPTGS